jgi:hypothetical protein
MVMAAKEAHLRHHRVHDQPRLAVLLVKSAAIVRVLVLPRMGL